MDAAQYVGLHILIVIMFHDFGEGGALDGYGVIGNTGGIDAVNLGPEPGVGRFAVNQHSVEVK